MKIACRCGVCGVLDFMQDGDTMALEIDFKEKTLTFVCKNKECRHINVFDFGGWGKQQKQSPLPLTRIV
jgi:hypothetical protein